MNKHLDRYLCDKYPEIFADRYKSPQETCMCWGFPEKGWFFIIDALCGSIQRHIDNPPWVKKRGSLLKELWNNTVWNHVVYPIASFISFGEWPKKKFTVSTRKREKWQWNIFNWFNKWFSFNIRYEPPKTPIPQVVATQIKEKFGGLRFYCNGGDDYTRALINYAEVISFHVCEECGVMDETVCTSGRGWVRTLCEDCVNVNELDIHKKIRDKDLVKAWNKARKDESK